MKRVGGVKVIPTWNGGGTVKLVIINSSYKKPDAALISSVQEAIDPLDNQGTGVGIAPIGHVVKVEGIQEVSLKIGTILALQPDWKLDDIKESVTEVVDNYFTELAALWEDYRKSRCAQKSNRNQTAGFGRCCRRFQHNNSR